MAGACITLPIAAPSRSSTACGVHAGAIRPHQLCTVRLGSPLSGSVGTSGVAGWRGGDDTASGRTLPAWNSAAALGMLLKLMSIWPPARSLTEAAALL